MLQQHVRVMLELIGKSILFLAEEFEKCLLAVLLDLLFVALELRILQALKPKPSMRILQRCLIDDQRLQINV